MKIKQIELIGFKSFAEKTTIPLDNGITCIVGPNGCGKSNIVDAFRWVLGEQSAKSLRGDKMEEVIFQGTDNKKQKGMSEVCLTFALSNNTHSAEDNGDSKQDFIQVSRRLYRSGESEYLINKKQCRLKDIRDLLLDTGLDVKSYSILDQQRIAEIVNSKPQDRRFLIEEIAGVMKYKIRKAEAEAKLDTSKQNLLRINDIVIERKRQLGSLDRLAKKAMKYKKLLAETKEIETKITKFRHYQIDNELTNLQKETLHIETQLTAKKAYLSELSNKIETLKLELSHHQKELSDTDTLFNKCNRDLADAEKKSAIIKTHIENYKEQLQRLNGLLIETQQKRDTSQNKLIELQSANKDLKDSIKSIEEKINNHTHILKNTESKIKEYEILSEAIRKDIFKKSEEISLKRNDLNKRLAHLEHLNYKEAISNRDNELITKTIESLTNNILNLNKKIENETKEFTKVQNERQLVINKIKEVENHSEILKQRLSKNKEDLARQLSRLESIIELFNTNPSISTLKSVFKKDFLTILDILVVDKEYESAIEALLFERLNAIYTDSLDELEALLKVISEKNLVRTTIFYDAFQYSPMTYHTLPVANGIICRASDLIQHNNSHSRLIELLKNELSNCYIVGSINDAITYIKNNRNNHLRFVTSEGVIIDSDGWVIYGKVTEVLKIKRQSKELEQSINSIKSEISVLEKEINNLSTEKTALLEQSSRLQTLLSEKDKALSLNRHSIKEAENDLQRKKRRLESMTSEFSAIQSEKESVRADIERLQATINELESTRDNIQKEMTQVQQEISRLRTELSKSQEIDTSYKLQKNSMTEKLEASLKEIKSLERFLQEYDDDIYNFKKSIENTENTISNETSQLSKIESHIDTYLLEIKRLSVKQGEIREAIDNYQKQIISLENQLSDVREENDTLLNSLTELNQRLFEKKVVKDSLEREIYQKYGINLNEIEFVMIDLKESEEAFNILNEKIRDIGPVSLDSITEYEMLKNDYDFLVKQQQDLILSIEELEEAINKINTTTRKRLYEAYNLLKDKFNNVFTQLFGGGKADILLTDDKNIIESGLEIVAQPPGKKNQNINQLSGGEKALTSLALLFAGFLIKPSPLCILDEADAPLDESNTERFSNMIKELSKDTQFLIITHNRITMEIADYLYGITMEEPGVSKTISMQFKDIERVMN